MSIFIFNQCQLQIRLSLKKSDKYTASEPDHEESVCVCEGMPETVVFYIVPDVVGQVPVEGRLLKR